MKEIDLIYILPLTLLCLFGILCVCRILKKWQVFVCSIGILFFAIIVYKKPVEIAVKKINAEERMKREKEKMEEIKYLKEIDETNPELTNKLLKKTQALVYTEIKENDVLEFSKNKNKVKKVWIESESKGFVFDDKTGFYISWDNSTNKLSNFYISFKNKAGSLVLNFQSNNFICKFDRKISFKTAEAKKILEEIYEGKSFEEVCTGNENKIKI